MNLQEDEIINISVIVTIYNHGAGYLKQCLNSLQQQTLENIEIILVDNAATAENKAVIEQYRNDNRFKIIKLEKNKGYGRALNIGLKAAKGEYVAFVDSDDWVEPDMYHTLYGISKNNNADIIKGLFYKCNDGNKTLGMKFSSDKYNKMLTPEEIKEYPLMFGSFWSAIYKRKMLIDNRLFFHEISNPAAEDIMFILETYFYAKSIYITPHIVFNKRLDNPNSSMKTKDPKCWNTLKLYKSLEKFVSEREGEIDKSLLGVKTKREFLNFFWHYKGDITRKRLSFILNYSRIFHYNIKCRHLDETLFNEKELKCFYKVACNPLKFYLEEKFYQKKHSGTHEKRYIFGVQYYCKKKFFEIRQNPQGNFAMTNNVIVSAWFTSGVTEELVNYLTLFYQGRFAYKHLGENDLYYIYLSCLLERGEIKQAKKILNYGKNYFSFDNLYRYIYLCDFARNEGITSEETEKSSYIAHCFDKNIQNESLKKFLAGKSIAVVGNSGRELGLNKGSEIDSHDVVIRFGNFPYEYGKDYGYKTNIWVRTSGGKPGDVEKRAIDKFDFVLWNQDFKHSSIQFGLLDYMYEQCKEFPEKYIYIGQKYRKSFIEASSILLPTTGAMLVWYLDKYLGNIKNADMYGFAFLDGNSEDSAHYYDDKCRITLDHSFDLEVEFLHNYFCK